MSRVKSGVIVTVDGQQYDLADVDWVKKTPCGCIGGVTVAYLHPFGGGAPEFCMTPQAAAEAFYETKAEREQAERRGMTYHLMPMQDWSGPFRNGCPHTPKWGYERPCPAGMVYASDRFGRGRTLHLVPREFDRAFASGVPIGDEVAPLCGGKASYGWHSRLGSGADCEKCIKVAVAQRDQAVAR